MGVAAHITSAAAGGPRYDHALSSAHRAGIANGIWLCQNCAKLVDNDPTKYTVGVLNNWKEAAERAAFEAIGQTAKVTDKSQVGDKWVTLQYPALPGITAQLESEGFKCYWSNAKRESEMIDIDGWEPVLWQDRHGLRFRLKVKDESAGGYLILLKKRKA